MKLVIIGGVAGGASAAARARRLNEDAEIIMFERGEYISFANCGLPYHISGTIPERDSLLVMTPEAFKGRVNADVRVLQEVTSIDRDRKVVTVRKVDSGETYEESYDKLIIATGSSPVTPPIEGVDDPAVLPLWTLPDMDRIMERAEKAKSVAVLGAGFVGIEAAENLHDRGLEVHLIDMEEHVCQSIDGEMAVLLDQELASKGVGLHLGVKVTAIRRPEGGNGVEVVVQKGEAIPADFVLMSVGVRPNSQLAADAGLELSPKKGIIVDEHQRTNDPDIYAVGDVVSVLDPVTGKRAMIPLAGPANRQGRVAADNIFGRESRYVGSLGTSVVQVFDLTGAHVGRTAKQLTAAGIPFRHVELHPPSNAKYYPGFSPVHMKLIFDDEGKILGAQAAGYKNVEKQIDVIATAMKAGMTVYDLEGLELAYAPPYGTANSPVNHAGMVASNVLRGDTDVVYANDLPKDAFFLDTRLEEEAEAGTLPGATVIPLGELRERLNELPKDRFIVAYCQTGLRAYVAERMLKQNGFKAANLSGGWLSWRQYHPAPLPSTARKPLRLKATEASAPSSQPEKILDVTSLQCPGPLIKVRGEIENMTDGQVLEVKAGKAFRADLEAWCGSMGHELLEVRDAGAAFIARIRKGGVTAPACNVDSGALLGVPQSASLVVFSNDLDKVLAAFIIATGLASLGTKVNMFFTFWGLSVLRKDPQPHVIKDFLSTMFGFMLPRGAKKLALSKMHMMGMGTAMMKYVMAKKNVATLPELIQNARDLGVTFTACDMAMDVMGISREELLEEVDEIAGVGKFAVMAQQAGTTLFI